MALHQWKVWGFARYIKPDCTARVQVHRHGQWRFHSLAYRCKRATTEINILKKVVTSWFYTTQNLFQPLIQNFVALEKQMDIMMGRKKTIEYITIFRWIPVSHKNLTTVEKFIHKSINCPFYLHTRVNRDGPEIIFPFFVGIWNLCFWFNNVLFSRRHASTFVGTFANRMHLHAPNSKPDHHSPKIKL